MATKRSRDEIMEDIATVYEKLSPEALSCDGELNRSEVNRRRNAFQKELNALQKELGEEVEEMDACMWRYQKHKVN